MSGAHPDRRSFLKGRFTPDYIVRPPWTREASVRKACTGCGVCTEVCPQAIIALDHGYPAITFSDECTRCGQCADACSEPVFDRDLAAFPHIAEIGAECFAARGIVCQSCGDFCPETAIRFAMRVGGPALPFVDASLCTGCGACIAACPTDAIKPQLFAEVAGV
jgi:ferredoxin-type protein NapF